MGLFDWLGTSKKSAVHRFIVQYFTNGMPVWTRKNFEALAKEGFEGNIWVYRCIMAISQAAASVPWVLYQKNGKTVKEIEDHPLLDLLDKPNFLQSKQEFIEAAVAFSLLSGNSYIEMLGGRTGPPKELWPLRPDRVHIIPSAKTLVGGFKYTVNGREYTYKPEQVMHLKHFSALDDFYGLSPIAVAGRSIDGDNFANAWNASMLQNGARPSGAMVTPDVLSGTQYDRLKTAIDGQMSGAENAGKPMLLEGGLDWKEMSLSPRDMDFIAGKKITRLEICAAFGVPPEIVGDHEHATYSNYQEARQAFYQDTVLPMLDRLRDKFNAQLVPRFGERLVLDYDTDQIEALQENRDNIWKRSAEAVQLGVITINEARRALGYEDITDGDRLAPQKAPAAPEKGEGEEKKAFNLPDDESKARYWKSFEKDRERFYAAAEKAISDVFVRERKRVLDRLSTGGRDSIGKAIDESKKDLTNALTALYVAVMEHFGGRTYTQLKYQAGGREVKEGFELYDAEIQRWIAAVVAEKVVMVTDTTKDDIRAHVAVGVEEGESIPEIAARIDTLYLEQIIPKRSTVIARTEVIGASNAASRYAADQTGLPLEKEWLATVDQRTRSSHRSINGQRRAFADRYSNGLMFPADPKGPAKEVIQCRCTEIYHVLDDE